MIRQRLFAMFAAIFLLVACIPAENVMASSASIEFSADFETVRVDDVFEVTLTLSADIVPGQFEGYISYNDDVLEYVTGPNVIAGGEGILKLNDLEPDARYNVRKYVLFFKAIGIGSSDIAMRGTPEVYEAEMGFLMSVSSAPITIKVQASAKASSDASIAALKITPGTLTPAFSPEIYEYSVKVPYETTDLLVSAAANHPAATVKIEGNTDLDVGQNRVLILVTAEDGTVNKYVIYAARETAAETGNSGQGGTDTPTPTENPADADPNGKGGTSSNPVNTNNEGVYFYAVDEGGAVILNAGARYTIEKPDDSIKIPDGYFKTSILISGHTVTAYSPTEDLSSDFLLLVLSWNGGAPELYSFDRVEKTIQRYSSAKGGNTIGNTVSGYSTLDEQELVAGYEKSLSSLTLVIAILSGLCMLLLILTIRMALKSRKHPSHARKTPSSGAGRNYARGGSSDGNTRKR